MISDTDATRNGSGNPALMDPREVNMKFLTFFEDRPLLASESSLEYDDLLTGAFCELPSASWEDIQLIRSAVDCAWEEARYRHLQKCIERHAGRERDITLLASRLGLQREQLAAVVGDFGYKLRPRSWSDAASSKGHGRATGAPLGDGRDGGRGRVIRVIEEAREALKDRRRHLLQLLSKGDAKAASVAENFFWRYEALGLTEPSDEEV